jgi:reactive intermediate/imine deaminase
MNRVALLLALLSLAGCAMKPVEPPLPQFITPPGDAQFASDLFGYSQAVRTGPWIIVSAQIGWDTEKRGFPQDFVAQATCAFKNLEAVLKAAGAKLSDVVEITTYQLDMDKFNDVVDVRNEFFGEHRPAWTAVGVKALPLPQLQFQVKAVAYAPVTASGSTSASKKKP